jgi:two-component system, OmpR family, response regulator
MIRIMMIEDDTEMAELIGEFLSRHSIALVNYETPELGLSALKFESFDLLILDLSLPGMDGLEVCREVRRFSDIPIIISSARADITDKTACFSMGADDYLPKPYDTTELLLRIHSILRRYKYTPQHEAVSYIFELNRDKHEIRKNGMILDLTNAEFGILAHFITRSGYAISREEILTHVDEIHYESSLKSIDVIIGRIRQKIEEDPKKPRYLIALRGIGYKLINE